MTEAPQCKLYDLNITVTLKAPWLVHGNDPGLLGLDAVQLRTPTQRRALPGTLLVGRIRDAWHALGRTYGVADVPNPAEWFGPQRWAEQEEDGHGAPKHAEKPKRASLSGRSRIFVADLEEVADTSATDETTGHERATSWHTATRVKIDDLSGAADDGMLQFIEQGDAPGATVTLKGVWRAWLRPEESQLLAQHIAKGIAFHSQLGALRNVGFGQLAEVVVDMQCSERHLPPAALDRFIGGSKVNQPRGLLLHFTQPLSVANKRINGNVFESGDIITGATIKGALATAYAAKYAGAKPMPAWFDHLRVTHAFPATVSSSAPANRPVVTPLSWVCDGDGHLYEHLAERPPVYGGRAVAFQPDWKGEVFARAQQHCAWGKTTPHLRVRTAIQHGKASDGQLFAYQCVVAAPGTAWLARLDLPEGGTPTAWQELAELFEAGQLGPVGKTDAFGTAELLPEICSHWMCQPVDSEFITVVLQSDALLLTASQAKALPHHSPEALHGALQQCFQDMAAIAGDPNSSELTLHSFRAQHRLAGGSYLYHAQRADEHAAYSPYFLTAAGSVFSIQLGSKESAALVAANWADRGLPLTQEVKTAHGGDWRRNTFIPENGWGEVLINPKHGVSALPALATQGGE